jgi:hypothetical protein
MNRIFDHFLTVEEVEDGELLSESEDEETPGSLSNYNLIEKL